MTTESYQTVGQALLPDSDIEEATAGNGPELLSALWARRTRILLVLDFLCVLLAFVAAFWARYAFDWPYLQDRNIPDVLPYAKWAGLLAFLWVFIMWREGGYRKEARGIATIINRIRSVFVSGSYAGGALLAFSFMYRELLLSRFVFVTATVLACGFMICVRTLLGAVENDLDRAGHGQRRLIIVGMGDHVREFIKKLRSDDRVASILGVLSCRGDTADRCFEGVPVLGRMEDLPTVWADRQFNEVFLAPHYEKGRAKNVLEGAWADLVEFCNQNRIPAYVIPPGLSVSVVQREVGAVSGTPVLRVEEVRTTRLQRFVKRSMDLAISGTVLFFGLPVWLLIGLAVKLGSSGDVFYGHDRLHGNESFSAWKFRTMVENADQVLKEYLDNDPELRAEWEEDRKLKEDPRVTRIGSVLRKLSLDEVPQLWNVLKGEMSLIGPRPIAENEADKYGKRFSLYERVKPGLTGLWQVSGRSDTTYEERVYLDSYYVRHWSVWLDMYILVRTVGTVLSGAGAY